MKELFAGVWDYMAKAFHAVIIAIAAPAAVVADALLKLHEEQPDVALKAAGVFLLLVLDTATGLLKAAKKGKISSFGFSAVVQKSLAYSLALIASVVASTCLHTMFPLSVVASAIMLTELLSIVENTRGWIRWPAGIDALLTRLLGAVGRDRDSDTQRNGLRSVVEAVDQMIAKEKAEESEEPAESDERT